MAAAPLCPGDMVRIRDARWSVTRCTPHESASLLDVRGCDGDNLGVQTRFLLPFEPVERLPVSTSPLVVKPRRWRRIARHVLTAASPAYDSLDSAVAAGVAVLPFQLEPALAVIRGAASRVLIADEVGLGKTIQAALVIAETLRRCPSTGRALVVCPAGLREQWQSELRTRFALDSVVLDSAELRQAAALSADTNPWGVHPVVITSIDYIKRAEVMRSLEGLLWDVEVFDEAHALTGRSDRRAAARALAGRARTVVLLTATPHSGDDEAFARLTTIGDLGGRFPLCAFRRTRADAGLSQPRRTQWLPVRPTAAELRMHEALITYARLVWSRTTEIAPGAHLALAVLTRRACSGASSLARSIDRRLELLGTFDNPSAQMALPFATEADDDEPAAQLAARGLEDGAFEHQLLLHILMLAEEAARAESKVAALRRLLRRARQPAIVFTEYRDTLTHLAEALSAFAPVRLHGGMSPAERKDALRSFTHGDAQLLVATDTASEGLNLHQRCRLVINLEVPWTPLRLEQRIGRVDRIGQTRRVHAIHLVATGTSEDSMVAGLGRRQQAADRALSAMRGMPSDDFEVMRTVMEGTAWGRRQDSRHQATHPTRSAPPDSFDTAKMLPLPPGSKTSDLREVAALEATRILLRRRLAVGNDDGRAAIRPIVTIRRRPAGRATFWCAFRFEYTDARGHTLWDTVAGIRGLPMWLPGHDAAATARWFGEARQALEEIARDEHVSGLAALVAALRAPLALAREREEAISGDLRECRARMAAQLVQAGLFDSRTERAAATQAAVLEEAQARAAARLSDLAAWATPSASRRIFAFAAILPSR